MNTSPSTPDLGLPPGRIDIHSHLLPGVDDGCIDLDQAIQSIRRLRAFGYVGSICTPHIFPEVYLLNTVVYVENLTFQFNEDLRSAGVTYRVWPGGEVRIFDGVIDWLKNHGVPTLAGSRCVLTDFWEERWPPWVETAYEWLLGNGFQPIVAHPERLPPSKDLETGIPRLLEMGVLLQGNFRSFTGEEGYNADRLVRQWTAENHYTFLATDMHRPESLDSRLYGIQLLIDEFGTDRFDALTIDAPRRLVLGAA